MVKILIRRRHSGFNMFCGPRIPPSDKLAMKTRPATLVRLWRIIRPSFALERMTCIPGQSKVYYQSKVQPLPGAEKGKKEEIFDALKWLAAMPSRRNFAKTRPPTSQTRGVPPLAELSIKYTIEFLGPASEKLGIMPILNSVA